jgi:chromosome segregation ATPase
VNDPSGLEQVFNQHRHSKGPFYLALAEVTQQIEGELQALARTLTERESRLGEAQKHLEELETCCQALEEKVQTAIHQLEQQENWLAEVQEALERAELLQRQGFGPVELARLRLMLNHLAEDRGVSPAESVGVFFRVARQLGQVAALELEIVQAETRVATARQAAEMWETEVQSVEARTKAREWVVLATEEMLEQGVKPEDILKWQMLLESAGTNIEELDRQLEHFSGLAAMSEAHQEKADNLQLEITRVKGELKGMQEQRSYIQGELEAMRSQGLAELRKARKHAVQELEHTGKVARGEIQSLAWAAAEHAQIREESATLKECVQIARSLGSNSPQVWKTMSRPVIQHLLAGIATWAKEERGNVEIPPPAVVRQNALVPTWSRVTLSQLLLWALSGVFTPEERQALATGR